MAIEPVSNGQNEVAPEAQTQVQQLKAEQQAQTSQPQVEAEASAGNGQVEQNGNGNANELENQMNGMSLGKTEAELHAACAEGRLEDVRAILSRGLEALESLDMNTGCTPIVLAIRGNHHDVVRELLSAGAIVPPPGLTNDPLMLSILYPQPMYGMPPQFMGMPPQEYYSQPPFYPGQPQGMFVPPPSGPGGARKDGAIGSPLGNMNNLPPADVSKSIPCRNFPNCKYGASCVFFHPRPQQFYPAGSNGLNGPNGAYIPQGYESGYPAPYPPAPGPYFAPSNGQYTGPGFVPAEQAQHQNHVSQAPSEIPQEQQIQHDQTQNTQAPSQHVPSAGAPVFIPGFQPVPNPAELMTSPPPSQFGLSPLSPSMLGSSLPSIPPAEAFFAAASPPNGFMPPPPASNANAAAHARRQSFNQQQYGMPGKPFGHGKKPSFSGGPKPWLGRAPAANGAAKLGSWKDGNPPPCAFFNQGNCRNGEYCKFPHLDAEGNDTRHPDVIRGVIAPLPSLARQTRGMRMNGPGFGSFDPAYRQQQHQHQMQFLQHQRMAAAQAQQGTAPAVAVTESSTEAPVAAEDATAASAEAQKDDASAAAAPAAEAAGAETPAEASAPAPAQPASAPTTLPSKPAAATAAVAPVHAITRSASQPGVQRVHANGNNSRSHSPAPSNVSFHGNGHPRRAGSRVPQMNGNGPVNGARPASTGGEKRTSVAPTQRVPRAEDFPVLGTPTNEKKEPQWNAGKTAAQVLLAPAPPKPEVKVTAAEEESESDKGSVTMDSDSESDAVIISTKASSTAVSGPASPVVPAAELKRAPVSFASAVSAATIPSLEATPVALKA